MSAYIQSAKKSYAIFLSLAAIYIAVCATKINMDKLNVQLQQVDNLLQLHYIAKVPEKIYEQLKYDDFWDVMTPKNEILSQKYLKIRGKIRSGEMGSESVNSESVVIPDSYIIRDVPSITAWKRSCKFVVTRLSGDQQLHLATDFLIPDIIEASMEDSSILSRGRCLGATPARLDLIMLRDKRGKMIFAMPEYIVPDLPYLNLTSARRVLKSEDIPYLMLESHEILKQKTFFNNNFLIYSSEELRSAIISYTSKVTGTRYSSREFDGAIRDLFDTQLEEASFAGVSAPVSFIIRFGPILLFAVMWRLWRTTRAASANSSQEEFWIATDVKDILGFIGAITYDCLPFIFTITVLVTFGATMGQVHTIFGYGFDFVAALNFEFDKFILKSDRAGINLYASIMGVIAVAFLMVAFMVTKKLLVISVKYLSQA